MIFRGKKIKNNLFKKLIIDYSVTLKAGDIIIQLQSEDKAFSTYIKNHYLDFKCDTPADYLVRLYKHDRELQWDAVEVDDFIYSSINFDEVFFYRQHKHKKELDIILPKTYKDWEIDNILKLYFSGISINHNTILLHASAIIKDEKAILFTGQSGAGKSTISNLSGFTVIHDDIIALSNIGNNQFCLRTIPFKINYKNQFFIGEIAGFYRIFQSHSTFLEEINKQEQLMHLLFSVWNFDKFNHHSNNEKIMLEYCMDLLQYFSVKKLYFSKTKDFLQLI